jgi:hypothetical protein
VNVKAMIISQLKKDREAAVAKLTGIDAALAAFGGGVTSAPSTTAPRTRKKRTLSPEHIAKMVAARQAKRAEGANGAVGSGTPGETPAPTVVKESHPRLPTGPKTASLADAAND